MQIPWTEIIIAICTVVTTAGSIIWIMTKEFAAVRKEMADESKSIRGEMADGFKEIRGEMADESKSIRGEMADEFKVIHDEFKEVRADLRSIDARVSRIEGYITGRDYNENRKIS